VPEGAVEAASVIRAERAPSLAARVARAAREAVLGVDGVVDVTAGPLGRRITPDRNDAVAGVVATALPDGGYELALHLVAQPLPLHALADRVRQEVRTGLAEVLPEVGIGPVSVAFEDLKGDRFPQAGGATSPPRRRAGRRTRAAKR